MENEDEFEVDNKLGADTKDKKISEQDLETAALKEGIEDLNEKGINTDELLEDAKEKMAKEIDDEEHEIRENWELARDRLPDEIKEKITDEDIENLTKIRMKGNEKGEKTLETTRPEIKQLAIERKKVLQEKEDKLFKEFKDSLGLDMGTAGKKWNAFKRAFLISFFFGPAGAFFMVAKDLVDYKKVDKNMSDYVKKYVKTGDKTYLAKMDNAAKKMFGNIVSESDLHEIITEKYLIPLLRNEKGLKTFIVSLKEETNEIKGNFEKFVTGTLTDKDIEEQSAMEEQEQKEMQEAEEEEDPEPELTPFGPTTMM